MGAPDEAGKAADMAPSYAAEPPPPYSESSSHPKTIPAPPPAGPSTSATTGMTFPPALDGFYKVKLALQGYLAVEKDEPLYPIQWHAADKPEPEVVLYERGSEPGQEGKQLSGCRRLDMMGRKVQIMLPPQPGSLYDHSSETLTAEAGFSATCYRFAGEVGPEQLREEFEWRPLGDKDDPDRGDLERKDGGFKLLRLSPAGGGGKSDEKSSSPEVVAVCCRASTWRSLTKSWEFRFRGSSLSGAMGERFELLALTTGLQLWTFEFQTKLGMDPTKPPPRDKW